MINPAEYTMARSYRMMKERKENNNDKSEVTPTELAVGVIPATGLMVLEAYGLGKVLSPVVHRKLGENILKSNPKESFKKVLDDTKEAIKAEGLISEPIEELAELAITQAGTEKGITTRDIIETTITAMAGGTATALAITPTVSTVVEAYKPKTKDEYLARELNKAINSASVNQDTMNKEVSELMNPKYAKYKLSQNELDDMVARVNIDSAFDIEVEEYKKESGIENYELIEKLNPSLKEYELDENKKAQIGLSFEEMFSEEIEAEQVELNNRMSELEGMNSESIKGHYLYDMALRYGKDRGYKNTAMSANTRDLETPQTVIKDKNKYGGEDNTIVVPATYERNYQKDFMLNDKAVARIQDGKATKSDIEKLKHDIAVLENDPNYALDKLDEEFKKEKETKTDIDKVLDGFEDLQKEIGGETIQPKGEIIEADTNPKPEFFTGETKEETTYKGFEDDDRSEMDGDLFDSLYIEVELDGETYRVYDDGSVAMIDKEYGNLTYKGLNKKIADTIREQVPAIKEMHEYSYFDNMPKGVTKANYNERLEFYYNHIAKLKDGTLPINKHTLKSLESKQEGLKLFEEKYNIERKTDDREEIEFIARAYEQTNGNETRGTEENGSHGVSNGSLQNGGEIRDTTRDDNDNLGRDAREGTTKDEVVALPKKEWVLKQQTKIKHQMKLGDDIFVYLPKTKGSTSKDEIFKIDADNGTMVLDYTPEQKSKIEEHLKDKGITQKKKDTKDNKSEIENLVKVGYELEDDGKTISHPTLQAYGKYTLDTEKELEFFKEQKDMFLAQFRKGEFSNHFKDFQPTEKDPIYKARTFELPYGANGVYIETDEGLKKTYIYETSSPISQAGSKVNATEISMVESAYMNILNRGKKSVQKDIKENQIEPVKDMRTTVEADGLNFEYIRDKYTTSHQSPSIEGFKWWYDTNRTSMLKELENDIINKENDNDTNIPNNMERDSNDRESKKQTSTSNDETRTDADARNDKQPIKPNDEQNANTKQSSNSVHGSDATIGGEGSDTGIQEPATTTTTQSGASGDTKPTRSSTDDADGTQTKPNTDGATTRATNRTKTDTTDTKELERGFEKLSFEEKLKLQKEAEQTEVTTADLENIQATLPVLLKEQMKDVLKVENRFFNPQENDETNGKGILFTNGTGTGKTYTGLGAIKRFVKRGKNKVLIVVPTDVKAKDWIEDGKNLYLDISQLRGITDKGNGVSITTYANFYQNESVHNKDWDLVVYDESHYLLSNQAGDMSATTQAHFKTTNRTKELQLQYEVQDGMDFESAINKAQKKSDKTKVIFLSATPFKGHKALRYADGYLFTMGSQSRDGGYNSGSGEDNFFISNFGYKMRYNKLTKPDKEVNVSYMERKFADNLVANGAMSGRSLKVDADYSREFVDIMDDTRFQDALDELFDYKKDKYESLRRYARYRFYNYVESMQLYEAIKAKSIIPRVKEHLALGRKVVLFHRYKSISQGANDVFDFSNAYYKTVVEHKGKKTQVTKFIKDDAKALKEFEEFKKQSGYHGMFTGYENAIDTLKKEFDDMVLFNGEVPKKKRKENISKFNGNESNVILIQEKAGKEGISLHDIEGKEQRVLINLGVPDDPIGAIQIEGRIYRNGVVSDAVYEYPILGISSEAFVFGTKINERVGTVENLAMGSGARSLKEQFKLAYENAHTQSPNLEQGKGGKSLDTVKEEANPYDNAISDYFSQGKGRKNNLGKDYFATPEPVGLKMVEWADIKEGQDALEPSVGHGAIGKFFPENSKNTFIEMSYSLADKASVNVMGNIIRDSFENHSIHNKYDSIVMNPPYGKSSKTAMEHLAKAYDSHLRSGGRVIALVPDGASMDKRFQAWIGELDKKENPVRDVTIVADIKLPTVTFERAGTSVATRILILDKDYSDSEWTRDIDLRSVDNIKDLFEEFKDISIPAKYDPNKEDDIDSELNSEIPQDNNEFLEFWGTDYTSEAGKGQDAVEFLLEKQDGHIVGAFTHPELGDIDLVWGDEYAGLKHIIERRTKQYGEEKFNRWIRHLSENIENGMIESINEEEAVLITPKSNVLIRLKYNNIDKHWLMTSYRKDRNRKKFETQTSYDVSPLVDESGIERTDEQGTNILSSKASKKSQSHTIHGGKLREEPTAVSSKTNAISSSKNTLIISNDTYKSQDELENDILEAKGFDSAGKNYIQNYKTRGFPKRPSDGAIDLAGKLIHLPNFTEPVTANTLRILTKSIIGNRLYDGRVKGKSTLGTYNRGNTSVRIKSYDSIETMAHEMAHFLDFHYKNASGKATGSFFRFFKKNNKEFLESVSYTQKDNLKLHEGFAEFVRLWTTNYNELKYVEGASEVISEFEKLLDRDSELKDKLMHYREEAHKYYYQGSQASLSAHHDSRISKEAKKEKNKLDKNSSRVRQQYIDANHSVKLAEAKLMGDVAYDGIDSAFKQFQLIKGASGTVDMVLSYGIPYIDESGDIKLDTDKKGLDEIFEPVFDKGAEEVKLMENYFMSRRANELMEQGRENKIPQEHIIAGLKLEIEYPHFKTIFEEYQAFNDDMLEFYVGMNLITPEQLENFKEMNKDYVPFHRVKESMEAGRSVEAKTNMRLGQRLKGGTATIDGIMDNIYSAVERNVKEAYIARAKSKLFETILKNKGGEFAVKIGTDSKKVKVDIENQAHNIAGVLNEMGMGISKDGMIIKDPDENMENVVVEYDEIKSILILNPSLLEAFTHGHKPNTFGTSVHNVIIDGKKMWFEVNDAMIDDTLNSQSGLFIGDSMLGNGLKTAMMYKNISTAMITSNPLFYITNALRDTVSAGVLSKDGFIPFYHTLKGMVHFAKKNKVYKDFMVSGGAYSTRRTALGQYDDIVGGEVNVNLGAMQKVLDALAWGADLFEQGTRIGEFELSQKRGNSNLESAYRGREISTDFSIRGSDESVAKLLGTIAFAKAGINSIDKLNRRIFSVDGEMKVSNAFTLKNSKGELLRHKRNFYLAGSAIASLSVMLFVMNKDDERYRKLTKDQKSMYWWIYLDNIVPKKVLDDMGIDAVWRLPKPYDIGMIFASMPEMMSEYIYNEVSDEYNVDKDEILDRFVFGLIHSGGVLDFPSIAKGVLEVGINKDWRGVPIESLGMQFQPKEDRARERTPEIYKALGNEVLSPVQIHHLTNSFLGLYGKMLDDTMRMSVWNEEEKGEMAFAKYNPLDYLTQRVRGKEVEPRTKYDEIYYELYKEAIETNGKYAGLVKTQDKKGYEKFIKDTRNKKMMMIKKKLDKSSKEITRINKYVQAVRNGETQYKTKEEKENRINEMYLRKHKIMEIEITNMKKYLRENK
jgi:hypothetical protein